VLIVVACKIVFNQKMSNSSLVDWPAEAAAGALVQWDSNVQCQLVYDAAHHYLRVVHASSPETIYDTIDVDDMIGADISIELKSNEPIRAISTTPNDNAPSRLEVQDTQAGAKLTLYVYPRKDPATVSILNSCGLSTYVPPKATPKYTRPASFAKHGARLAHHRTLALCPCEDLTAARTLLAAIRALIRMPSSRVTLSDSKTNVAATNPPAFAQRHYLIIANPRSGPRKNAVHLAETLVQPMLHQAGIETTLCATKYFQHALQRCQYKPTNSNQPDGGGATTNKDDDEKDIATYDGIVVMGGDGSLHEVLNGIATRSDAAHILATVPIGVVGCGTANGLARSLAYAHDASEPYYGVYTDTFYIAKGNTAAIDLSSYHVLETIANSQETSIDDKAPDATTAAGTTTTVHKYTSFLTFTWGIIAEVDIESEKIHWLGFRRFDVWAVVRVLFLRKYRVKLSYTADPAYTNNAPSIQEPVPSSWTTMEDDIILFWASQVSHASVVVHVSPKTKVADGVFTILLVRGSVSRYRLALILLGLETGSHEHMVGAEWIQCTAYRLEATGPKQSFNDLDGEVVANGPIQGK
jgi:sphingosine kinase